MADTLAIDFEPSEWRYHYDCIRIFTESDNLLVPIHAYPVVNEVTFPSRLDFGSCVLGETQTRAVRLGCSVPIQFEFRVDMPQSNPDFRVTPKSGIIPANGVAEVCIDFTPLNFGTCSVELLVNVSQFSFEPISCVVTGNCLPGGARQRSIELAAAKLVGSHGDEMTLGASASLSPKTFGLNLTTTGTGRSRGAASAVRAAAGDLIDTHLDEISGVVRAKGPGSGAVFDGGADLMSASAISAQQWHRGPPRGSPGGFVTSEAVVNGLLVPAELNTNAAVNYVLTQEPGKLKPKALKAAIFHQRTVQAEQRAEQEALRSSAGGGTGLSVHAIKAEEANVLAQQRKLNQGATQSRQLREPAFLQDLGDLDRDEKEREFKSSSESVGASLLTPEEVDAAVAQRTRVDLRLRLMRREVDRASVSTALKGPLETNAPGNGRAETLAHATPDFMTPAFDETENNVWFKRRTTLQRFVYLVGKWIVRRRAEVRLAAIWARLGAASTREEVRALVELDNQQAEGSSKLKTVHEKGLPGLLRFELSAEAIHPTLFPCFVEDSSSDRTPIAQSEIGARGIGFSDLGFLNLKVPQECEVLGYGDMVAPSVNSFAPHRDRQTLRVGAVEETGVRAPRDATPGWNFGVPVSEEISGCETPPPPPGLMDPEAVFEALYTKRAHEIEEFPDIGAEAMVRPRLPATSSLDTLRPSQSVRAFARVDMPVETDAEWALRPQPLAYEVPNTYGSRLANSIGSTSLHAYRDVATLSEVWRPRRQRRSSALLCLEDQHRQQLWAHLGVPPLQYQPAAADAMSDSESDDDEDDNVRRCPFQILKCQRLTITHCFLGCASNDGPRSCIFRRGPHG